MHWEVIGQTFEEIGLDIQARPLTMVFLIALVVVFIHCKRNGKSFLGTILVTFFGLLFLMIVKSLSEVVFWLLIAASVVLAIVYTIKEG